MSEQSMSYTDLMRVASKTADTYLQAAIESVEGKMGKGAAAKYPQIVAAVIGAAASDYHAAMLSHRVAPALDGVADALRAAGDSSRLIADAVGEAGHEIASAIPE